MSGAGRLLGALRSHSAETLSLRAAESFAQAMSCQTDRNGARSDGGGIDWQTEEKRLRRKMGIDRTGRQRVVSDSGLNRSMLEA